MKKAVIITVIIICTIFLIWAAIQSSQKNTATDVPVLEVALYPYIDDVNGDSHTETIARLEKLYKERYPDDELEITISPDYSTYFENSNYSMVFGSDGPDIVVVEQTVLDNLVEGGYIRPFAPDSSETKMQMEENLDRIIDQYEGLSEINGEVYYIPTWLCAYYTFTRNPAGNEPASGYFGSNGTLPDLYLSAYASTYCSDSEILQEAVYDAVAGSPDPEVIGRLSSRLSACTAESGENMCLSGYYNWDDDGCEDFGAGNTDRYFGYSEMLYWILRSHPEVSGENISITGTVFGSGAYPSLAWVDGFVINNNTGSEMDDQAIRFIDFYNSREVKEMISFSFDTKQEFDRVPRYLLPATADFYTLANVSADPHYNEFYPVILNMTPFPTGGLRGNMDAVYRPVYRALTQDNGNKTTVS
jgi:thiamine pyridinylase